MATDTERKQFRKDVGYARTDTTNMPDTEVDLYFEEAEDTFTDTAAIKAATRIYFFQGLIANAAKMASYKQNQTTENVSDIFEHILKLLDYWKAELGAAIIAEELALFGTVRSGKSMQMPTRLKEYPDG